MTTKPMCRNCDYDEPEPYACPHCDSEREPVVRVSTYVGTATCPACNGEVDTWLTAEGLREQDRQYEEQARQEAEYWEAEDKAHRSVLENHECLETLDFFTNVGKPADNEPERYEYRKGCPACKDALSYLGWHEGSPHDYRSYPDPDEGEPVDYDDELDTDLLF